MQALAEAMSQALREHFTVGYLLTSRKGRRILANYARMVKHYAGRDEARFFINSFYGMDKI